MFSSINQGMDMVKTTTIPLKCALIDEWDVATYRECFTHEIEVHSQETATSLFHRMMMRPPRWITLLMAARNAIVKRLGLKTDTPNETFEGDHPDNYKVGDYIGFFKIEKIMPEEIVASTNDKHLDAYFSLLITDNRRGVAMISTVKTKEKLGDIYMFFIAPFHRLIVKYLLGRLRSSR